MNLSIMKSQSDKNPKKLTSVLLVIYVIVLSWIILFKMQFNIFLLHDTSLRSINFIPFAGSLIVNGKVELSEIILNVIVFIPFGIYMSMVFQNWGFFRKIVPSNEIADRYDQQYPFGEL